MDENKIENNIENSPENKAENNTLPNKNYSGGQNQSQIAGAIIIAGIIIAGAILLKDNIGTNTGTPKKLADAPIFNQCLDSAKYASAVADSLSKGRDAGVNATPNLFILEGDKIVNTVNGAEPTAMITQKIDQALAGNGKVIANIKLDPVSSSDFMMGSLQAKVTVVEYADFQCPFCGKLFQETEPTIMNYVKDGKIDFVYRDFPFLGSESIRAAIAARCAADQGKFWEYHDYLYNHQSGENQGAFSDVNLKSFASVLKLK
ncbi:MAG TPA: thioredoxin domain-containing protein [Candidatus Paceibacterota bacterium]|jgi:protein-disulfide isomerase|nr:thioredoxin domain-containing protein [Candidatus Paceibacterota bacterium]